MEIHLLKSAEDLRVHSPGCSRPMQNRIHKRA